LRRIFLAQVQRFLLIETLMFLFAELRRTFKEFRARERYYLNIISLISHLSWITLFRLPFTYLMAASANDITYTAFIARFIVRRLQSLKIVQRVREREFNYLARNVQECINLIIWNISTFLVRTLKIISQFYLYITERVRRELFTTWTDEKKRSKKTPEGYKKGRMEK